MRSRTHSLAARTGQFIGMVLINLLIDFQTLAQSMGVSAVRVERAKEINAVVTDAIASCLPHFDRN